MKFPYLTRRSSYWDGARGFLCKLQVRFTMVIMHHIGESLMWATGRMAAVILVTSRCQAISNHHADSTAALLSRFSHYNLHHTYFVIMMTSSNGNIFRVTGPLWGESTGHRWLPDKGHWRGALMFSLICAWIKRMSKQSRRRWFETLPRSLWRHCNVFVRCRQVTFLCDWWVWLLTAITLYDMMGSRSGNGGIPGNVA